MTIRIALASALLALSAFIPPAFAEGMTHDHAAHSHSASPALVPAEVRAIDVKARKVTLKHGELKNLGMPAMTMSFLVDKRVVLPADLKAGDKVQVQVEDLGGVLVVTALQR